MRGTIILQLPPDLSCCERGSSSSVEPADTEARSSSSAATAACATPPPPTTTMREGFLFSSFSDGLAKNAAARSQLQRGLVRVLLRDWQQAAETALSRSVRASPCNGPNIEALGRLEGVDRALDELEQLEHSPSEQQSTGDSAGRPGITTAAAAVPELRLLYIPTALYALRPESSSTPGKQRQRARADGKQRRDALVRLLHEELLPIQHLPIAAVTLDLDDGSVKQPVRSSSSISQKDEHSASHQQQQQQRPFPTTGREALQEWNPHVVYVQGGNTFWLYHCLHKDNNWRDALQTLVQREDTLYCGASAGAILAGASLETACWKGWDDPRVVPGRETYGDWKNVPGLDWCGGGGRAFFPHYEPDEWGETVRVQGAELVQRRHRDKSSGVAVAVEEVVSLRDDQVWHLDGATGQATIL